MKPHRRDGTRRILLLLFVGSWAFFGTPDAHSMDCRFLKQWWQKLTTLWRGSHSKPQSVVIQHIAFNQAYQRLMADEGLKTRDPTRFLAQAKRVVGFGLPLMRDGNAVPPLDHQMVSLLVSILLTEDGRYEQFAQQSLVSIGGEVVPALLRQHKTLLSGNGTSDASWMNHTLVRTITLIDTAAIPHLMRAYDIEKKLLPPPTTVYAEHWRDLNGRTSVPKQIVTMTLPPDPARNHGHFDRSPFAAARNPSERHRILETIHQQFQTIADLLGTIGSERAYEVLVNDLAHQNMAVYATCIDGLLASHGKALPFIVKHISNPDKNIRLGVVATLLKMGIKTLSIKRPGHRDPFQKVTVALFDVPLILRTQIEQESHPAVLSDLKHAVDRLARFGVDVSFWPSRDEIVLDQTGFFFRIQR